MFSYKVSVSDGNTLESVELRAPLDDNSSPPIEASKDVIMAAIATALVNLPGNFMVACSKIEQVETPLEA